MATLKYFLQSKAENANIYIRFSINREKLLKRKTGFVVNPKNWNSLKENITLKDEDSKVLNSNLRDLKIHIEKKYNNAISSGLEVDGDWLKLQIDLFNNKIPVVQLDILTNYIQKYIDDAPFKQNAKKELGLSTGRIRNLKLFKNTIDRYETKNLKGEKIIIRNVNLEFSEKFKTWLLSLNYSINYVGKNIANLKTICIEASKNNIEVSTQLNNIKKISEIKEPEDVITLSEKEQIAIRNADITNKCYNNARKWLLLGCLIGQRGGDLLNITEKNIVNFGNNKIIELKQQKTGKLVAIPLIPEALKIIESGMPYKISLAKFNLYIKEVCKISEIITPTTGRKKIGANIPTEKSIYPKHEVISSHVCRRSFATNFYGRIPTPILMNITAHGTEKMFLSYIGKTTYDNAYQMLEYFNKL
jgi:integrase